MFIDQRTTLDTRRPGWTDLMLPLPAAEISAKLEQQTALPDKVLTAYYMLSLFPPFLNVLHDFKFHKA